MLSSVHKRGSLPKLSTSKEITRRDSLSSSRTGDSGYNSDLDITFSPLDFIDSDQHVFHAPLQTAPGAFISSNLTSIRRFQAVQGTFTLQRSNVTSHPDLASTPSQGKLCRIDDFDYATPETRLSFSTKQHPELALAAQDSDIEKWIKDNLPSHNRPKERVSSITSLSSATSCEIYTDTDMSDAEPITHIDAHAWTLPRSTLKTIDIIMRKIEVNLRCAAYLQCNGGDISSGSNNNASRSQQSSRKATHNGGKRKSRAEDDNLPPNDNEEDGPNKRRRGSLATVESSETGARFACPFYKHEPNRFRNRRTCPGPGWPTVHRMKEHLYRAHAQSIYCPRCYATFDADVDLSNHLRSAQCQVSAPQPIEGIDRETLKTLRKRSPALRLEEDKWRDVYHLLFPDVAFDDIPSPFYDSDSPSEESRRFRRELLRRVQQELVNTAEQLPGPVEQQLLRQVAQIIRRCEDDLLSSFDPSGLSVPPLVGRRASDTPTEDSSTQPTPRNATPHPARAMPEPAHSRESEPISLYPAQTPSSDWIDWDAIFPPPDVACNETFPGFSVPMWT